MADTKAAPATEKKKRTVVRKSHVVVFVTTDANGHPTGVELQEKKFADFVMKHISEHGNAPTFKRFEVARQLRGKTA